MPLVEQVVTLEVADAYTTVIPTNIDSMRYCDGLDPKIHHECSSIYLITPDEDPSFSKSYPVCQIAAANLLTLPNP
jgi:hypothetical protein